MVSPMAWSITTIGSKGGSCGHITQFYVAIAHGKGVVMCNQYHWHVTGERCASLIDNAFLDFFRNVELNLMEDSGCRTKI